MVRLPSIRGTSLLRFHESDDGLRRFLSSLDHSCLDGRWCKLILIGCGAIEGAPQTRFFRRRAAGKATFC